MILSDNETKLDLLNNQAIAKTIVDIIKESKESVSIGVHGDWGAGKSSILAMVEDLLSTDFVGDINSELYDDFDLEAWEDDSDNVSDEDTEISPSGYLTVRFNSWQYQGFEDAKIALMSAIVKALQKEAIIFYKKHPIKGAIKRLKNISQNIWKNLDKLSLAKNIGKVGVSLATGTTPIALLDIAMKYSKDIFSNEEKRNEFINTAGALLKNTSSESSCYKEMAEFRLNYKALFKAAHVEKLVVLIDDLDRCLPRVAIETLEAVRMFLAMDNTAFIIAADDEMIRYSVKEYFPRVNDLVSEEVDIKTRRNDLFRDFSEKYLEKLIQIPLHIPIIGVNEAQLYVTLLLIEAEIGESDSFKNLVQIIIDKLHKPWSLEPLSTEEIKSALGDDYEKAAKNIKIAKSIDKILAENSAGNPRNIKRFINMLLLRTQVGHHRCFEELKMAVLAKMMLAEQYNNDFYKAIAGELREDGSCSAFDIPKTKEKEKQDDTAEKEQHVADDIKEPQKQGTSKKDKSISEQVVEQSILEKMLSEPKIIAWMEIEPSLAGEDLRPYFFVCKESEDFFFRNPDEQLRELFSVIRGGSMNVSNNKKKFTDLEDVAARKLFKEVTQDAFTRDLTKPEPPKIIQGIRRFVEFRPELQDALCDFLLTLPTQDIGIWALGEWDTVLPKTCSARAKYLQFIKKIGDTNENKITKAKAKDIQE